MRNNNKAAENKINFAFGFQSKLIARDSFLKKAFFVVDITQ